jgi:hypothetical protein
MTGLQHYPLRIFAIILVAGLAASCGPQKNQSEKLAHERGGRHGLRAACADDIQKFCASADKKRRCLKENSDKLSDACKTALAERGNRHGGKDKDTNTNTKSTNSDDDDN